MTFKFNDIRQLLINEVQQVTPEMWANFVKHTKKEENKMLVMDYISDEILDETPLTSHVTYYNRKDNYRFHRLQLKKNYVRCLPVFIHENILLQYL